MDADPSDTPPMNTIAALVDRVRSADDSQAATEAAESLFRRAEPIARIACRCEARDLPQSQVEELVQESLLVAWRQFSTFDPQRGRFEGWVRGICSRACSSGRRRRQDLLTRDGVLDDRSADQDAMALLGREERVRVVTSAIDALETADKEMLYFRYVHELPRKEIGALLKLDEREIKTRLQKASRHLKEQLSVRLKAIGPATSPVGPTTFAEGMARGLPGADEP